MDKRLVKGTTQVAVSDGEICAARYASPATRYGVERAREHGMMNDSQHEALKEIATEREIRQSDLPKEIQGLCYSWGPQ